MIFKSGRFNVILHFVYTVLGPGTVSITFCRNSTKSHISLNEVEFKSYKGKTRDFFFVRTYITLKIFVSNP